jgi:hypothetical protein
LPSMNKPDRAEIKRLMLQVERDLLAYAHLRTPWSATGTTIATQQEEATINAQMVRQMELRRQALPEQRLASGSGREVANERRRTCAFCCQRGDHPTPAHCLRALER